MSDWETSVLPDFTVHGFHTGNSVDFRLHTGEELTGTYVGYGMFSKDGRDYLPEEVVAWRPATASGEQK